MKKLIVALIAVAGVSAAQAASYVGVNLGRAEQKLEVDQAELKDSDIALKVYGGWKFNKTFGLEAGYNHLGKASAGGSEDLGSVRPQNIYVAAVASFPVNEDFSLFAKVGAARNRTKFSDAAGSYTENHTSPLLGVGAEYAFNDKISAVAEYENFGKVVKGDGFNLKADLLSYGLRFKF